jgi:hypothetical protein
MENQELEDAADFYSRNENFYDHETGSSQTFAKECFMAGAKWQTESILKMIQSEDVQWMPLFDKGEVFEEIIKRIKNMFNTKI